MRHAGRNDRTESVDDRDMAATVTHIDRAIRDAFILLEALDRRTLAGVATRLTTAQYHTLAALAAVPTQSLGELAERRLCDKANVSGLVDKLVAAGLVNRARDPADGRRVALSLTGEGHKLLARATHARTEALLRTLAPLEASGLTTAGEHLARLVALLRAAVDEE